MLDVAHREGKCWRRLCDASDCDFAFHPELARNAAGLPHKVPSRPIACIPVHSYSCDIHRGRWKMLKRLTVFPGRIRKIIARRSLILDPCNDEASGILVCRNDFLPFRSIDRARPASSAVVWSQPTPTSSITRRATPRRNPTRHAHWNPNALWIAIWCGGEAAATCSRSTGYLPRCSSRSIDYRVTRSTNSTWPDEPRLAARAPSRAKPSRAEPSRIFPGSDCSHERVLFNVKSTHLILISYWFNVLPDVTGR